MLKDILKEAGFSDKEIVVYTALLEIGSSRVSVIAKSVHMNRSTAYVILDWLTEKGFVHVTERQGVKIYGCVSPEKIVKDLENTAKKYIKLALAVKKELPKIKMEHEVLPRVYLLKGNEGMKTVYEDALSALGTIRSYAFEKQVTNDMVEELRTYYKDLSKKKIQTLLPKEGEGGATFLPGLNIYDNKIVFASVKDKIGLIVESKELADILKKVFDFSWKRGGKNT
jgi:sugar-specific transcriptional regulator TrmB